MSSRDKTAYSESSARQAGRSGGAACGPYELFNGDRYARLRQGAEAVLADPAFDDARHPYDRQGLRRLVERMTASDLLDHFDDHNANRVIAFTLLDFSGGTVRLALRVRNLLRHAGATPSYDALAVISGLAGVLGLMVDLHPSG